MKNKLFRIIILVALVVTLAALSFAQTGNTINGFVFGNDRIPIGDAPVELLDEFSRTIARMRTSANGRFTFSRLPSGRFRLRVMATWAYEEQEQEVEIQNIFSTDPSGSARVRGSDNVQKDFYLRLRRNQPSSAKPEAVFVQSVPEAALLKYRAALKFLENKNDDQGIASLKAAIELFPEYFDALERLGIEYVKQKHYVPARLLFQVALQINPRSYKSWYGAAYSYYSVNDTVEALRSVEKAVELNPRSLEALLLNGVLLRRARRFSESETLLKKVNTLADGSVPEVHWHLALLYCIDLKRYLDAVAELELFLKTPAGDKNREEIKKIIADLKEKARTQGT